MMEYKGYLGKIEFDDEANIFHGEVINIRDVITFAGQSVAELGQPLKNPLRIISRFVLNGANNRKSHFWDDLWY